MFYHAAVLKQNFRITLVTSTLSVRPLFNDFGATSTSRGLVIENQLLEKISFPLFIQNLFDKKKTSTEGEKRKENFFDFV